MTTNQRLSGGDGKQGKLGKQFSTYAYARARVMACEVFSGKTKNIKLSANCFPSFPIFPQGKKMFLFSIGCGLALWRSLLPILGGLLPYLPTVIQYLVAVKK